MKKINKILWGFLASFMLIISCSEDKDLAKIIDPADVNAPAILAPAKGDAFELSKSMADEVAFVIKWQRPDYGQSISMKFSVDIDLKGGNFSDNSINLGETSVDTFAITHGDLNKKLLELGFTADNAGDLDIRVKSTVNYQIPEEFSEVLTIQVTPFSTVFPSIYMIGAAVGGWDPALAVEVASTGEPNKFSTIAKFDNSNGKNFRFFTNPDWGSSLGGYNIFTNYPTDMLEPAAGDGDPNFNFIGTPGWYQMIVDQGTGTITMKAVSEPLLYLTGDATHGWSWDDPVTSLKWIGHQIWEGDVTFTQNNYFRLFEQKDWGPVGYGHDIITNYDTNIIIIAVGHGDPNWQFVAASGLYHVKVDKRKATIVITAK